MCELPCCIQPWKAHQVTKLAPSSQHVFQSSPHMQLACSSLHAWMSWKLFPRVRFFQQIWNLLVKSFRLSLLSNEIEAITYACLVNNHESNKPIPHNLAMPVGYAKHHRFICWQPHALSNALNPAHDQTAGCIRGGLRLLLAYYMPSTRHPNQPMGPPRMCATNWPLRPVSCHGSFLSCTCK